MEVLSEHLCQELKVRVVNVGDLMTLQPKDEHPHGVTDAEFDEFTARKPVRAHDRASSWCNRQKFLLAADLYYSSP
jgi:phosphoketolase